MKRIIQVDHGKVRFYTNVKKIFFLILVLAGCQSGNKESGQTKELPVIDISKKYPEKTFILQDIADIEYIPLETTDEVLLGEYSVIFHVSDKYILVYEKFRGDIFVFNRNGKAIASFNRTGQGGEEYIGISWAGVVFDEKTEEIFVFGIDRILVYSLNGEFKRKLIPSDALNIEMAYIYDDETLLVYLGVTEYIRKTSDYPYKLLSKKDGQVVYEFDIHVPVRYKNRVSHPIEFPDGTPGTTSTGIAILYNMQWGQDFVIADRSSDTLYRLASNRELTPVLVRKPSVHSSNPRTVWTSYFTTDKFMLLQTNILDLIALEKGVKSPPITLIHDFETGETNKATFNDVEFEGTSWLPEPVIVGSHVMPKNTTVRLFQVSTLKLFNENKWLRGKLKELVSNMDEDDNPVVAIYKFK